MGSRSVLDGFFQVFIQITLDSSEVTASAVLFIRPMSDNDELGRSDLADFKVLELGFILWHGRGLLGLDATGTIAPNSDLSMLILS
jgi:hypothetical protein